MPREADHLMLTGDVLAAAVEDGEVRLKLGDVVAETGHASDVPCYGVDGFIAVPNDPDADGGAAQVAYLQDGDGFVCLGFRDNRHADKAGTLKSGDRAIVTDGPTRIVMKRATKTIALYTEQDAPPLMGGGKSVALILDGENGRITLRCGACEFTMSAGADGMPEIRMGVTAGTAKSDIVLNPITGVDIGGSAIGLDSAGFVTIGLEKTGQRPAHDPNNTLLNHALLGPNGAAGVAAPRVMIAQV